jgi:hypothetical protein
MPEVSFCMCSGLHIKLIHCDYPNYLKGVKYVFWTNYKTDFRVLPEYQTCTFTFDIKKFVFKRKKGERQTETEMLQNFRIYVRVLDWTQRLHLSSKVC